jgi:hypothetical protein
MCARTCGLSFSTRAARCVGVCGRIHWVCQSRLLVLASGHFWGRTEIWVQFFGTKEPVIQNLRILGPCFFASVRDFIILALSRWPTHTGSILELAMFLHIQTLRNRVRFRRRVWPVWPASRVQAGRLGWSSGPARGISEVFQGMRQQESRLKLRREVVFTSLLMRSLRCH